MADKPNPGSDEAASLGCTCPRMDNNRGGGYLGQKDVFVRNAECHLHKGPVLRLVKGMGR
jgi:hypothetical protein